MKNKDFFKGVKNKPTSASDDTSLKQMEKTVIESRKMFPTDLTAALAVAERPGFTQKKVASLPKNASMAERTIAMSDSIYEASNVAKKEKAQDAKIDAKIGDGLELDDINIPNFNIPNADFKARKEIAAELRDAGIAVRLHPEDDLKLAMLIIKIRRKYKIPIHKEMLLHYILQRALSNIELPNT
jgi:hypothetical protein